MVTQEFRNVTDQVVKIATDCVYIIQQAATTACEVQVTLKEKVNADFDGDIDGDILTFVDTNPDTIKRIRGNWINDGFDEGMVLTITDTVSNNGSYTIATVTEKTITLIGGDALTAETINASDVTITGAIPDTDWIVHETYAAGTDVFKIIEPSPTALRFKRTAGTDLNVSVRS